MRAPWWIAATFFASTVLSIETLPFSPPQAAESSRRAYDVLQILKRADNNCPFGYDPCTDLGHSEVCCRSGTRCSKDAANNIACCPTGASCTGSLTGPASTDTSFRFPVTATATPTKTATDGAITGSTITGAWPFIFVPTTFPNPGVCSSYWSLCQSEYSQCTAHLGGQYGVTVAGGGAGVTVQGGGPTAAVSVCSSLSQAACHGLNLGYCSAYVTGGGGQNNAAMPGRTSSLQDLVLGMVVGVAGMFI
ncbi:uncharacterized protein ACLA_051360 [Aspergillus clavatus NRRL 1]|uniref:GPI anchored protein n=1 Tax=Aspergillus clavatus (strain ATCC 1007 / CBS 513.65 / DSM 816 / NCTC 3887 / NRRL 1 / QM 1276 / 107) TaxID=344612 RepID=A1CIF9_ASPCL|nr:uncharacterized protein ACLA_051360 [Aspergillus clavatus NRRL 1]EAW10664.1 conserved hypothetical protein [Aspergillus clavatus NRRL 1]